MPFSIRKAGMWVAVAAWSIRKGGTWKTVSRASVYKGGAWKEFFPNGPPPPPPTLDVSIGGANMSSFGTSFGVASVSNGTGPYTWSNFVASGPNVSSYALVPGTGSSVSYSITMNGAFPGSDIAVSIDCADSGGLTGSGSGTAFTFSENLDL